MKNYYVFIVVIWVLAVFLMILTVGNPITKRRQAIDESSARFMDRWSGTIGEFYRTYRRLPVNLEEIDEQEFHIEIERLEAKIDYKIIGEYKYQLCTEFLTDTADIDSEIPYTGKKRHEKGYDCIDFEVSNTARNDFSATPVFASSPPISTSTVSPTPLDYRNAKIYVQQEHGVPESIRYMQADLSGGLYPEYTKDGNTGGKTIMRFQDGRPLLEFTVVTEGSPTHFLSHKKLSGSEHYLVSIESANQGDPEYYYAYSVSEGQSCSNQGVVDPPCGPIDINGIVIHFVGDLEDIEIANKFVASLKFL